MTEQDTAGVVNNVVDSLRGNPLVIGLLVINIGFLGAFLWVDDRRQENNKALVMELLRNCGSQPRGYAPQDFTPAPLVPGSKSDRASIGSG